MGSCKQHPVRCATPFVDQNGARGAGTARTPSRVRLLRPSFRGNRIQQQTRGGSVARQCQLGVSQGGEPGLGRRSGSRSSRQAAAQSAVGERGGCRAAPGDFRVSAQDDRHRRKADIAILLTLFTAPEMSHGHTTTATPPSRSRASFGRNTAFRDARQENCFPRVQ